MPHLFRDDQAAFVTRAESEALLAAVAARTRDPNAGIYGPDTISWTINREAALFLGAGRAAILQLAHPWVTAALEEHSTVMARPIDRFHNTFRIVFTMVFGTLEQAQAAARHLHSLHARIQGRMKADAGPYRRGSHYQANEVAALRWVYATLVESAVLAFQAVLRPLSDDEREAFLAETRILAALFGLPGSALPRGWAEFSEYFQQMVDAGPLATGESARAMARNLLSGAGSRIRPPAWYRALTILWLPQPVREQFRLQLGSGERRSAERALQRVRRFYGRLPEAVRFVGPYREAEARLKQRGRGVLTGLLTGLSNRFWIGEAKLPFA